MTKDVNEIREKLVSILMEYKDHFKISSDTFEKFEVCGTIEAMQGRKKVDGFFFASVVPKPKDVRLYFFPVYTHKDEVGELPASLVKALKGKSCFHIKKIDEEIEADLREMVRKSVEVYKKVGLLVKS